MTKELDELQRKAMELIKNPLVQDPDLIAQLAPIPSRLQNLLNQFASIQNEARQIRAFLELLATRMNGKNQDQVQVEDIPYHRNQFSRKHQTKLHIELDSTFLGGNKMVITDHTASRSLTRFLTHLYKIGGVGILEKLSTYRPSRALLVSRHPDTDYSYQGRGGEAHYKNEPITDSGFFVLTNSTTEEKADAIRTIWKILGAPKEKLTVTIVDKLGEYV